LKACAAQDKIIMKIFTLKRNQVLPIGLTEAWSFFSDPGNLHLITPPELDLTITSPFAGAMHEGQIITYTVRPLLGVRVTWVSEITHIDKPRYFIDRQLAGPYKLWHHTHHFNEVNEGVEIVDMVYYALPTPIFDGIINKAFVENRLKYIFDFRAGRLKSQFGGKRIS